MRIIKANLLPSGNIFQKLILLMLIGVGIPLILLSYLFINSLNETLIQQWNVLQTHVGQSVSSSLGLRIHDSIQELETLDSYLRSPSGNLDISPLSNSNINAVFLSFLRGKNKAMHLELLNLEGQGTQAGYDFQEEVLLRQIENTFRLARTSDTFVISDPVFSTKLNQLMFVVARPVFNRQQREAVLLAVVSLEPILKSIAEGGWSGIQMFIVNQKGELTADLNQNRAMQNVDYSHNEIVEELLNNVRGLGIITRPFLEAADNQSIRMIGTGALVPDTGWAIIAQTPLAEARAGISTAIWKIAIFMAGILLFILALSILFSHRFAQPLNQLAQSLQQVAAGNYSVNFPVKDTSEIGIVSQACQEMIQQVQKNLAGHKRALAESKQLFTGTIEALVNAIDGKDPYRRGHSERVTRISVEIAKIMNLPEEEIEKIKVAALIHDIGMITVDDRILKKQTSLTDEEFQAMKTHTTRGYEIIKNIPQLEEIAQGMQFHHERLDGKGYPLGLKGDEIPMIARVIMVADCFEAMTSKRPYHDSVSIDYALGTIRSSAGSKYDERVVEALEQGIKGGSILPHSTA